MQSSIFFTILLLSVWEFPVQKEVPTSMLFIICSCISSEAGLLVPIQSPSKAFREFPFFFPSNKSQWEVERVPGLSLMSSDKEHKDGERLHKHSQSHIRCCSPRLLFFPQAFTYLVQIQTYFCTWIALQECGACVQDLERKMMQVLTTQYTGMMILSQSVDNKSNRIHFLDLFRSLSSVSDNCLLSHIQIFI